MNKKIQIRMVTGMIVITMALLMTGCKSDETIQADAVKEVTEEQKASEEEPVILSIEADSEDGKFMLDIGGSRKLSVNTNYEGSLEYASTNEAVATIDADGTVTAVKNGSVTMVVTAGDVERRINVIVKAPVAADDTEEPEEESTEQAVNPDSDSNPSGTVGTAQTSGTTGNNVASNTTGSDTVANTTPSGTGGTAPAAPSEPATEAPAFNPADYYLDWYYIQDQVNARLLADYPNGYIGATTWYSYGEGYRDGYPDSRWTNESMINNIYSSIKQNQGDIDSSYTGCVGGMVLDNIEVHSDGTRTSYYTLYY